MKAVVFVTILASVFFHVLQAGDSMSDEEFESLIQTSRYHSPLTLMLIAKSGRPEAIDILRKLQDRPRHWKWKDFKAAHGFPDSAPDNDATIQIQPKALETALAAAGDPEALERIISQFNQADDSESGQSTRFEILKRLKSIATDEAIVFVASLLERDNDVTDLFPTSFRAAEALHSMVEAPSVEQQIWRWGRGPLNEEIMQRDVMLWKQWWKENAHLYGGTGDEVKLDDATDAVAIDDSLSMQKTVRTDVPGAAPMPEEKLSEQEKPQVSTTPDESGSTTNWTFNILGICAVAGLFWFALHRRYRK